jgi:hypothetical protein
VRRQRKLIEKYERIRQDEQQRHDREGTPRRQILQRDHALVPALSVII